MSNPPVLEVKNLSVSFGKSTDAERVVDGVSFSISKGKTHALVGESGSGKSLTALSILRLLPESATIQTGSISFDEVDLLSLQEREMRDIRGIGISMIFQEPMTSLNPVIMIGQQIAEVVRKREVNTNRNNIRNKVIKLLTDVGIPNPADRIDDYPHQLSGGQKQRVMIAMAIANKPKLLIADEPTTALDVTIQKQVLELIRNLQKEMGMSILFITHDLALVSAFSDTVSVMKQGKIVEHGETKTFFKNASHPYTHQLFNAIPSAEKKGNALATGEPFSLENPENNEVVLKVSDLHVYFPIKKGLLKRTTGYVRAVDGVNFHINRGETLALVGESGCGKTTVGKAILQLIKPTKGSIDLNSVNIVALSGRDLLLKRKDLQIVFQDPYSSMNPRMLIGDIISEGMKALGKGHNTAGRWETAAQLLTEVGLPENSVRRYPHEFSGGQRQRICIARALAVEPKIIICDEPTSALDVSVQAQILDLLNELKKKKGLSYLFITHNMSVVAYFADRVAVMNNGVIIETGQTRDVLNNPKEEYTRRLLEAVPKPPEFN